LRRALVLLGSLSPIVVAWRITTRFVHVEERMLEARQPSVLAIRA
jgi:hypothetical protein